jgi:hypothetical protein
VRWGGRASTTRWDCSQLVRGTIPATRGPASQAVSEASPTTASASPDPGRASPTAAAATEMGCGQVFMQCRHATDALQASLVDQARLNTSVRHTTDAETPLHPQRRVGKYQKHVGMATPKHDRRCPGDSTRVPTQAAVRCPLMRRYDHALTLHPLVTLVTKFVDQPSEHHPQHSATMG